MTYSNKRLLKLFGDLTPLAPGLFTRQCFGIFIFFLPLVTVVSSTRTIPFGVIITIVGDFLGEVFFVFLLGEVFFFGDDFFLGDADLTCPRT